MILYLLVQLYALIIPLFFFFNDTATTEIYTLSLHDALPICLYDKDQDPSRPHSSLIIALSLLSSFRLCVLCLLIVLAEPYTDRKSTRLNSSHANISHMAFCLKKKKKYTICVI